MDILLYNPLSSRGKNIKVAEKLKKKLEKKGHEVKVIDLLQIENVHAFLSNYKETDRMIILGGDGTMHRIINSIDIQEVVPQIFMYKAGSGNDFLRSIKSKTKLVDVKSYLMNLPILTLEHETRKVLNGAGIGLDGLVAYRVNESKALKNKSNYFKNSVKSFFQFKPQKVKVIIDGNEMTYNKVYFVSSMYSSYFGGGMKIAPKKKREDQMLQLVVVKDIPKWLLLIMFPTIYIGWHRFLKPYVKIFNGKGIKVELSEGSYLQVDGETQYPISSYELKID